MEEKKTSSTRNQYVKEVAAVLSGRFNDTLARVKAARLGLTEITKRLNDKEEDFKKKREEEAAKAAAKAQAALERELELAKEAEQVRLAALEKEEEKKRAAAKKPEPAVEAAQPKAAPIAKEEEKKAEEKASAPVEAEKTDKEPVLKEFVPSYDRHTAQPNREQPRQKTYSPQPNERPYNQQGTARPPYQPRDGERKPYGQRPQGNAPQGGQRPPQSGAPRPYTPRPQGSAPYTPRPQGSAPYAPRPQGSAPYAPRPQGGAPKARPVGGGAKPIINFVPKDAPKAGVNKKKTEYKPFDDKRGVNKKSALKGQLSISDFDENKTGYRKLRVKKNKQEYQEQRIKIEHAVISKEIIPLKELSEKIGVSAVEITKMLFKEGIIKTINDSIDFDTAAFVASELQIELELKMEKTAEEVLSEGFNEDGDNAEDYIIRPPVVTVMGHVDHGKTSLLDYIRSANVTAGEAGGITQHIGAYTVKAKDNSITFLDTPGHAAFTSMRARGAQVTDIAVIVIAADDGIMPQTVEAINHAKAAGVSIIVAANKIDKPQSNIDKIRQQLSEHEILVEDWGGDVVLVPVSAKTGEGVDKLLETILLIAELKELKANPNRKARGAVIEAKLDKGKGPVASILIQNGTLRLGDNIVAGTTLGKVRAMLDEMGRNVKEAGPSTAVSVLGLEEVPNAGDMIFAVDQEKLTKLVAEERRNKEREDMIRRSEKVTLDELFSKISDGDLKTLNIIIKADVQGSVEAVKQSLSELSNEEVKVNVIHAAVGAINETDVMLADSANSIIIGFNVRPDAKAKVMAERTKVDVKLYRIIYEAIDDVKSAMKGMLAPKFNDIYLGKAEVRETFKITGVGTIAGCYVTDGKIQRNAKLRIYRDDVMICEGNVQQLKRFKDDVKEVAQGFECGMAIENFNDIKVGDFIECYIVEQQKV